jgi:hypothetical protein
MKMRAIVTGGMKQSYWPKGPKYRRQAGDKECCSVMKTCSIVHGRPKISSSPVIGDESVGGGHKT